MRLLVEKNPFNRSRHPEIDTKLTISRWRIYERTEFYTICFEPKETDLTVLLELLYTNLLIFGE